MADNTNAARSSIAAPRTPRRARRFAEIVQCARRVFAEHGYDRASVAEIARQAGIAEGTVYTYFESKRALLSQVILDFYEPLIADTETHVANIDGARNQLRYVIWRQFHAFVEDQDICRLVLSEIRSDKETYDATVIRLARRYTSIVIEIVEAGIETGELSPDVSPQVVRDVVYGSIEHIAWRLLFSGKSADIVTLADQVTRTVCHGITQPGEDVQALKDVVADLQRTVEDLRRDLANRAEARPRRA